MIFFFLIYLQYFQIAGKYPVGGYSGHQKLSRALQAHLQRGSSTATGRKAKGEGLVHEHKETTALTANQIYHRSIWSLPMLIGI